MMLIGFDFVGFDFAYVERMHSQMLDVDAVRVNLLPSCAGICSTVLKKACRRRGILRWPFRKVRHGAPCLQVVRGLKLILSVHSAVEQPDRKDRRQPS